jgi:phosphatidylglycerol---prolipoprotein diacylglyceryl transferase
MFAQTTWPTSPTGSLLLLGAIGVTLFTWTRLARRDTRLLFIYIAALLSAFVDAKIVYLIAEGWLDWPLPDRWLRLATGKSILGALLGGYAGVEIAKRVLGYRSVTGDLFAIIAPLGIAIGRIGCLINGCCLGRVCEPAWYSIADARGIPRWPAVPLEFAFNLAALASFFILRQIQRPAASAPTVETPPRYALQGQHFHLFLISYGLFRFVHEFWRDTPHSRRRPFRLPTRRARLCVSRRLAFCHSQLTDNEFSRRQLESGG